MIRASISAARRAVIKSADAFSQSTTSRTATAVGTMGNGSAPQGTAIARIAAQSRVPRGAGRLALREQDQLVRVDILPCEQGGQAAQNLIPAGMADGNGGPQSERRQPAPARKCPGCGNQR